MDEDDCLRRFGLRPSGADRDQVRRVLREQAALERNRQGDGDTELMRLCCVQLFNVGELADVLPIWRAKESSWDAHCSIDVQLLCGAGLEATTAYLATTPGEDAASALDYLRACEAAGDFVAFSVAEWSRSQASYYLG